MYQIGQKNLDYLELKFLSKFFLIFINLEFVLEMTSKGNFCFESAGVSCKLIMFQHL